MGSNDQSSDRRSIAAALDQPLIGVVSGPAEERVVCYTIGDPVDDPATDADQRLQRALAVVGAWRDLDWDEFADDLDRLRHESPPTPPIEV